MILDNENAQIIKRNLGKYPFEIKSMLVGHSDDITNKIKDLIQGLDIPLKVKETVLLHFNTELNSFEISCKGHSSIKMEFLFLIPLCKMFCTMFYAYYRLLRIAEEAAFEEQIINVIKTILKVIKDDPNFENKKEVYETMGQARKLTKDVILYLKDDEALWKAKLNTV